ncbi:monooxygenase [Actinoplanes sp. NBRC 103695]|uniref:monooxygenase n=1 Tax=Actinoplanes sp. NBRC 103695 TaxID=3032202 RepID=UPI0024A3CF8B|nr:monooxygenase [Actinoplanes sp. NBRC 103695]GLZ01808.1 hypothetical protein Acsp02_90590 [Actinoplanes sp. NBRC 103695]
MKRLLTGAALVALALPLITACSSTEEPATAPTHQHASSAAAPRVLPLRPGEHFQEVKYAKPITPAPPEGGLDEYRCVILDPKLTKPQFLTGVQFTPQNVPIAHHAITNVIAPEHAAEVRARDAKTPEEGWTCFGSVGVGESTWVDNWTPNVQETLLEGNLGFSLAPGSLILMETHYSLLGTGGKPAGTDQSTVRLRLTDGNADTIKLDSVAQVAPIELPCATEESGPLCDRAAAVANVKKRFGVAAGSMEENLLKMCGYAKPKPGTTQQCDTPVPGPMTVYAARGHMHLLGRAIKVELNPGKPDAEMLLDVPDFNFDDQALQVLAQPIKLKAGDLLRTTCTHDAALRRQLPQLKTLPPRYVVWGEGTADEMCLGILTASSGS